MIKFTTEKTRDWVSYLSAISKITDEVCFHIDTDKLWFRGMDPAHISMIDFEIPKDDFSSYEPAKEEAVVCVLLDRLLPFVKKSRKDEKMEVLMDPKAGKFRIKITGNYRREFLTPVLDTTEKSPLKLPKVEYMTNIKMTTSALKEALRDIKLISEKVKITSSEDKLELRGETEEGIETAVTFLATDVDVLDAKLKDGASATYNVELMSSVVAELERISSIVNLDYGTDLPLKLAFEFPEEQRFNFYLAPRIEQ